VRILVAIGVTFLVTVVLAGVAIGLMASKGKLGSSDPALVQLQKPARGDLTESISAEAEVKPKTRVAVSARVPARIAELPCEEGDRVTKGEPDADPPVPPSVLVRLDAADLEAALASAEANAAAREAQIEVEKARIAGQHAAIRGTKASLAQARLDLGRREKLLQSRDVSQSDVDSLRCRVQELSAQLEAAEHSLKASQLNLGVLGHYLEAARAAIAEARDKLTYTTITSPIDGVVTRIHAEEGEMVVPGTMNNPGTVIMEVADLSEMLLVARVDETDVGKVRVGQRAVAQIHAFPDEEFEGTVDSIALKHDIGQGGIRYYETEIMLQLDGRRVYSGSSADVDIEVKYHRDILKVPSQAVVERLVEELPLDIREDNPRVDDARTYATVVYRFVDGEAVVTPVTIGASDKTHTVIVSGLGEEDEVIVGPYKVLEGVKHEQKVRDEKEAKAAEEAEKGETAD